MILYASGIMWLAASLQGVTGFGFMLLAIPGLILWLPAQVVVPALILVWIPLGTVQVLHLRKDVDWKLLAHLLVSAVIGLPLGAVILLETDRLWMQRGIGAMMVVMALLLFVNPGSPFQRRRLVRTVAGLISGVLAASTSAAGPPVAFLGLKQRWETARFRATLPAYFVAISLCCLPLHWEMDLLGRPSIEVAVSGLPGVVVGYLTGIWLKGRVGGEGFRWVVLAMVMGGGLAAVIL